MGYCMYLRKSRADLEAEAYGEGETLARHEKILIELANRQKLNIEQIYREVETGETIAARPVMQELLSDIENELWDGVLVMEVERLARGDTIDQGIVAQTFKYSNTLIVTPVKTYDPNNEFDEEYFEYGLFMSRREYKTINRRLSNGKLGAVKEGKYIGSVPPYGYRIVKLVNAKGNTLAPLENEASVVRLIFNLYVNGELQSNGTYRRLGPSLIVRKLNDLKIKPRRSDAWVSSTVRDILANPVYIGKIRYNYRPTKKKRSKGKIIKERPRSDYKDVIIVEGLHPSIIDVEIFNEADYIMKSSNISRVTYNKTLNNPLAGLVICKKCGRKMIRKPYKNNYPDSLMCPAPHCNNVSSHLFLWKKLYYLP